MITGLLALLTLTNSVGFCDTITSLAKPEENQVTVQKNTLETRLDELGSAIDNLNQQLSSNVKENIKSTDERVRREFEAIKKGLMEATNKVESKAKESGTVVSADLKDALKRLSRSIDNLATKVSK